MKIPKQTLKYIAQFVGWKFDIVNADELPLLDIKWT
jgi:hypothetical protein